MLIYPKPTTAIESTHYTSLFILLSCTCLLYHPNKQLRSCERLHGFALLYLGVIQNKQIKTHAKDGARFGKVMSALSGYLGDLVIILTIV